MTDALAMWTVYDHPSDYPDKYVARKFLVSAVAQATNEVIVASGLMELREALACMGLTCLTRSPQDEPQIVETWL